MFYYLPYPIKQPFALCVAQSMWNMARATEELNFKFYLILVN